MVSFTLALVVSFITSGLIVRLSREGALPWHDHELEGVQKFHAKAVPRIGGLGVAAGFLALVGWVAATATGPTHDLWLTFACGLPALLAGLLEDLTKRVGIKVRLLATMTSGALAFFLLGAQLREVQLP